MKQNKQLEPSSAKASDTPVLNLDTRSKILKAAIQIFSEIGYSAASLRQITDRAEVNHGLVKYHYNNKEELWRSSVKFLYAQLEDAFDLSNSQWEVLPTRDKIEYSMRTYMRFLAKNPELYRITMFETLHNSDRLDWLAENVVIPYTQRAMLAIKEGVDKGIFTAKIPEMNLFYLLMAANRYIFFVSPEISRVFGKDMTSDIEIKKHEDAVIELFLGHLNKTEQ